MPADPYQRPGFAIGRTSYLFRKCIIEELEQSGSVLNPEEAWILMVLDDAGGTAQTGALREVTQRDASTLTRQLDALLDKKFVKRARDAKDGRVINVSLTAAGRRQLAKVMPGFKKLRKTAVAGISKEDLKVMTRSLLKIQENLQSKKP